MHLYLPFTILLFAVAALACDHDGHHHHHNHLRHGEDDALSEKDRRLQAEAACLNDPGPPFKAAGGSIWPCEAAFQQAGARCRSRTPTAKEIEKDNQRMNEWKANKGKNGVGGNRELQQTVVNVAFHVVHDGATGELTTKEIEDSMAMLNEGFNGTGFSFNLMVTTFTDNAEWFDAGIDSAAERAMKTALRQGNQADLNVYSTSGGGYLGWATFPSWVEDNLIDDGVVIAYGSVPCDYPIPADGCLGAYTEGDTLTHEVGHWMGLYHTFQGGCSGGDQVDDTPPQRSPTSGCPVSNPPDTCKRDEGLDVSCLYYVLFWWH